MKRKDRIHKMEKKYLEDKFNIFKRFYEDRSAHLRLNPGANAKMCRWKTGDINK